MKLLIGILFGVFFTHNVEQTNLFKCKYDKQQPACEQLAEQPKGE